MKVKRGEARLYKNKFMKLIKFNHVPAISAYC